MHRQKRDALLYENDSICCLHDTMLCQSVEQNMSLYKYTHVLDLGTVRVDLIQCILNVYVNDINLQYNN